MLAGERGVKGLQIVLLLAVILLVAPFAVAHAAGSDNALSVRGISLTLLGPNAYLFNVTVFAPLSLANISRVVVSFVLPNTTGKASVNDRTHVFMWNQTVSGTTRTNGTWYEWTRSGWTNKTAMLNVTASVHSPIRTNSTEGYWSFVFKLPPGAGGGMEKWIFGAQVWDTSGATASMTYPNPLKGAANTPP